MDGSYSEGSDFGSDAGAESNIKSVETSNISENINGQTDSWEYNDSLDDFSDCEIDNSEDISDDCNIDNYDFSDCVSESEEENSDNYTSKDFDFTDCQEISEDESIFQAREDYVSDSINEEDDYISLVSKDSYEGQDDYKYLPVSDGIWDGKSGDSNWIPDNEKIPGKSNPDNKNWEMIKDEYGIEGIKFENGEPDFSEVSKSEVQISDFTTNRDTNFEQADILEAKKRGCEPDDVKKWRQENKYTWHEHKDCKTMSLVPSIVHNNVSHSGGISEEKKKINIELWG